MSKSGKRRRYEINHFLGSTSVSFKRFGVLVETFGIMLQIGILTSLDLDLRLGSLRRVDALIVFCIVVKVHDHTLGMLIQSYGRSTCNEPKPAQSRGSLGK